MPKFEYKTGLNRVEYNGENEIVFSKQDAGLTVNGFEKMKEELNCNGWFMNFTVYGVHNLKLKQKLKYMWALWKFLK